MVNSRLMESGGAGPSSAGRQAERHPWLRPVCHIQSTLANRDDCGKHAILSGCVPYHVLSRTPYLAVLLDRRERHVVTAQRSDRRPDRRRDRRPDRRPDLKLDTSDPSRGMPLDSTHILHTWMKYYADDQSTNRMPTEPDKHDLLGFPGV
jgi:hypothetical protein